MLANIFVLVFAYGTITCTEGKSNLKQFKDVEDAEKLTTNPIPGFSCDFDTSYCSWNNDSKGDFMWQRTNGSTPSDDTGPRWDHTTKDSNGGSYLYIETSSPRRKGDRARISSPALPRPGKYCLKFWHHMHGADVNDLNVYLKKISSKGLTTISHFSGPWSTEGNEQQQSFGGLGNWWNQHQIEFVITNPVEIVIEGVRGLNYRGDIAIDDITLQYGACPELVVDCNFEENFCGWTQMSGDQFNWLPSQGETPTRSSGPSVDHTLGNSEGHYIFVEASSPRIEGDRARLLSPPITCIANAQPILQFWIHMFGSNVGALRVYLLANIDDVFGQPIWLMVGDQGKKWNPVQIPLQKDFVATHNGFYIVIEGERQGYRGDAAIDDISLVGCHSSESITNLTQAPIVSTTEITTTTIETTNPTTLSLKNVTSLPEDLDCTFDEERFCAWENDQNGDFLWTLGKGKTVSFKTGPRYDHTTKAGWYIYMEASAPRLENDQIILRSPTISSNIHACLRFYYNMHGKSMGKLQVLTSSPRQYRFNSKWAVDGEQSANDTDWLFAEVDIYEPFNYDIVFRGIRGDNFYSDMAIDDISVTMQPCGVTPTTEVLTSSTTFSPSTPLDVTDTSNYQRIHCDFDSHSLCFWNQMKNDDFDFSVSAHGRTPSPETGPEDDQTGGGQFAYIEVSRPRTNNDRASIESPVFTVTTTACFSMWYHMYGNDTGYLSIILKLATSASVDINQPTEYELWRHDGQSGNIWKQVHLNIFEPGDFQIILEAARGDGWKGDIAIDNVKMEEGECAIFNCTFQTRLCGWIQDSRNDDFDWTPSQAGTPSPNTGPLFDHTFGTDEGRFLFIKAMAPRELGDSARLISPTVPSTDGGKCLRFWYHSFGDHVGALNVFKQTMNSRSSGSPLWFQTGHEGDQWLYAQVNIEETSSFRIIFEGVRGSGPEGDIAIDDVTISNEECYSCCGPDVFRCGNNFCVPSSARCNGEDDCGDGSDESFCNGCGVTHFRPNTSPEYGTIVEIQIGDVDTPLSARRFQTTNNNEEASQAKFYNVLQINDTQKSQIRHPGSSWFQKQLLDIDILEEEPLLLPARDINKVEIIRSKREVFRSNSRYLSAIRSKLLRTYNKSTENAIGTTAIRNSTTVIIKQNGLEVSKTSQGKTINVSQSNQEIKENAKSYREMQKTRKNYEEKEKQESLFGDRLSSNKRPSPLRRKFKPNTQGAISIPSWQWNIIRESTRRDKKEPSNRNGLIERMKRDVMLRITGGTEARAHSWPWQGAYYTRDSHTDSFFFCGATLIERYWLVTAAHCTQLGDEHIVIMGEHDLYGSEGTEQQLIVEAVYVNRDFDVFSDDLKGDIALIKLKYPVLTNAAVQPACLMAPDDPSFSEGHVCAITGWGGIDVTDLGIERYLRQGEVPIISQETCQTTYNPSIQESMICAGGNGANTCRGDSGGPLICERNNTAFLVGITSFGDVRCLPGVPGVYTSLQSYMGWLSMRINQEQDTCS